MARTMKTVQPRERQGDTLVIAVNPLQVPRGRPLMPRGGTHGSGKHQGRAKANREWRRQVDGDRRWVA
jgi:hypothetical protein